MVKFLRHGNSLSIAINAAELCFSNSIAAASFLAPLDVCLNQIESAVIVKKLNLATGVAKTDTSTHSIFVNIVLITLMK